MSTPAIVPLSSIPAGIEEVEREIRARIEGLDGTQLNWQPGPRSWSVLQVLEHLATGAELYLPVLRTAIDRGLAEGTLGTAIARGGWVERLFLRSLASKVKMKAPGKLAIRGASDLDPTTVVERWATAHRDIAAQALRGRELDPNRVRITSPLSSLLRLGLGAAFTVLVVHERRHAAQIDRIIADPGFPRR